MTQFDQETAVEALGDGLWSAHVSDAWNIGANPNGGYLAAIALRAMGQVSSHPHPVSVTTHFLRPGTGNAPAEVRVELVRAGRSVSTVRATLSQQGKERIELLATFADLALDSVLGHRLDIPMPDVPPADQCVVRSGLEQGVDLPILDRVDTRIHPDQAMAGQVGAARVSGWLRMTDGREPDVLSTILFADALPPPVFGLLGYVGWVPTLELTVHIRRPPTPGWVFASFKTSDMHNGRMIEDGTLWDQSGELIAQSRQLSLLMA